MSADIEIDFFDPDAPKNDTPYERKKKQVLNTLDDVLKEHPLCPAPFELEKLAVFGSRSLKGERALEIIKSYFEATGARVIITANSASPFSKYRKIRPRSA